MSNHSKEFIAICLLIILSFILAACKTEVIIETVEVPVEVEVEKPVQVEVLITPTPEPIPQGGVLTVAGYADAQILNPILAMDSASDAVNWKLFLGLFQFDPFSGELIGELAESWTVSEDGLTYTFKLREDVYWTDGMPVTAHDFKFTYDAIDSDLVETHLKIVTEEIKQINVIDDYTIEITLQKLDCIGLLTLSIAPLPSHMYAQDFSDIMDNPLNQAPTVTNGPFKFQEWVHDDHITLVRNEDYYLGAANVDGWIMRIVADQSALLAAFLSGETDMTGIRPQYVSVIEGEIAKGSPFKITKSFSDGFAFVALNIANPENPEMGWVDENENGQFDEGEPPNLDQEPHSILGDVRVRQAIAYSLDYTNIINRVIFGQGAPIVANVLPAIEWAYNDELEPYTLDLEMAAALLDEAGWVRENDEGVRMKDGEPLALSIMTNAGNEIRENIAAIMQDNLETLGFDITLEVLEWGTVLSRALGQQYDMLIIGWVGMGSDPEDSVFWAYRYDAPGSGFNFVSYYNEEVEKLLFEAKSILGCSTEDRGPLYKKIQEFIHEHVPYAYFYTPLNTFAWNSRVLGINPGPWDREYNIHQWYLEP